MDFLSKYADDSEDMSNANNSDESIDLEQPTAQIEP
jgi:hypothetical protein